MPLAFTFLSVPAFALSFFWALCWLESESELSELELPESELESEPESELLESDSESELELELESSELLSEPSELLEEESESEPELDLLEESSLPALVKRSNVFAFASLQAAFIRFNFSH